MALPPAHLRQIRTGLKQDQGVLQEVTGNVLASLLPVQELRTTLPASLADFSRKSDGLLFPEQHPVQRPQGKALEKTFSEDIH